MRIAVVAALAEEIAPLARDSAGAMPLPAGRCLECVVDGHEVSLMSSGDGAERARHSVDEMLAATRPQVLIGIGCAGGLTGDLAVGDLVVGERVVDAVSGRAFVAPGSRWLERGMAGENSGKGTIVSAEAIAWRGEDKRRLAHLASSSSAVVDLESAAWAAAATEAGVPFVIVRGVSDLVDETLPLDFEQLRDDAGSVDRRRVFRAACRRPWVWPGLLRLRFRLRAIAHELAAWSAEVIVA